MESSQELKHWGIKGQKWGIRRYQNPDGTLTEAGKKHYKYQNPDGSLTEEGKKNYMDAFKSGKINVRKLSTPDLNMINDRYAKEKLYAKNYGEYKDSLLSTKIKKAVGKHATNLLIDAGGSALKMLAFPVKYAFKQSMKELKSGGKNDSDSDSDSDDEERYTRGMAFVTGGNNRRSISDFVTHNRINAGRNFVRNGSRPDTPSPFPEWGTRSSRSPEDILRGRSRNHSTASSDSSDSSNTAHNDDTYFIITRLNGADELYHYGTKGQKWGVRRYQNQDGTLTPEGKERYNKGDEKHPDLDYRNDDSVSKYVRNVRQKYQDAARNEAVWKKHGLGQDTIGEFVKQKKYGNLVNHINSSVKESREAAIKASDAATKSRENARKPGPLWENMNRKNVEYWDKFQETADEYIKKNFSSADQEVARGVVYWYFIDW